MQDPYHYGKADKARLDPGRGRCKRLAARRPASMLVHVPFWMIAGSPFGPFLSHKLMSFAGTALVSAPTIL